MNITFKLFILICSKLDRFLYEPLFWVIILLFTSGIKSINNGRNGLCYTSRMELISGGIAITLIAVFVFWWYWFAGFDTGLMRI